MKRKKRNRVKGRRHRMKMKNKIREKGLVPHSISEVCKSEELIKELEELEESIINEVIKDD